jgi:GntR family transcriptional regulator/MocR family aminotransferase
VCEPQQVLIVNGSQQALDLTAKVLLDPGDRVLVEEPFYAGALGVFVAAGAEPVMAPVDAEGLDVAAVGKAARRIRLAYVTPSHQFPTGVVMSLERRLALLARAEREGAHVLEDDYDSEYRYTGRPVESLQGIDRTGRVIYMGTFSKLMFPALRLGYLVLPPQLVKTFHKAKALTDVGTATLEQSTLADFIHEGHFERHVRLSRARNAARRAVLLEAITEHFGDRVEVSGDGAGIHVLLWLRDVPARRLEACIVRARAAGVGIYSAASCYREQPPRAGLILGYNALGEARIRAGIRRLATVLG